MPTPSGGRGTPWDSKRHTHRKIIEARELTAKCLAAINIISAKLRLPTLSRAEIEFDTHRDSSVAAIYAGLRESFPAAYSAVGSVRQWLVRARVELVGPGDRLEIKGENGFAYYSQHEAVLDNCIGAKTSEFLGLIALGRIVSTRPDGLCTRDDVEKYAVEVAEAREAARAAALSGDANGWAFGFLPPMKNGDILPFASLLREQFSGLPYREAQRLESAIFSEAEQAIAILERTPRHDVDGEGAAPPAANTLAPKPRPERRLKIEERMYLKMRERPESADWTKRQWAQALDCSDGTISGTRFWKELQEKRENAKLRRRRGADGGDCGAD